jgi:Restriction endonuclease S subunits
MSPLYTVFKFENDSNEFYEHYFKTTGWHTYMRQASSTGARHDRMAISSDDFMAMPLPVSSPAEQQKIANCLSSLDELIAAQARKVDALKTHKKGLTQQLFPREGETQPRLRFPEFRNAREWEITTVGGLVEAGWLFPPKDGNHGNIHPKSSDYVASGIPFIMASDLKGGLIDIKNCHFISKNQADKLQKRVRKRGGRSAFA